MFISFQKLKEKKTKIQQNLGKKTEIKKSKKEKKNDFYIKY